jgi:hypothetical protein
MRLLGDRETWLMEMRHQKLRAMSISRWDWMKELMVYIQTKLKGVKQAGVGVMKREKPISPD